jgi:hypothetical protein
MTTNVTAANYSGVREQKRARAMKEEDFLQKIWQLVNPKSSSD